METSPLPNKIEETAQEHFKHLSEDGQAAAKAVLFAIENPDSLVRVTCKSAKSVFAVMDSVIEVLDALGYLDLRAIETKMLRNNLASKYPIIELTNKSGIEVTWEGVVSSDMYKEIYARNSDRLKYLQQSKQVRQAGSRHR